MLAACCCDGCRCYAVLLQRSLEPAALTRRVSPRRAPCFPLSGARCPGTLHSWHSLRPPRLHTQTPTHQRITASTQGLSQLASPMAGYMSDRETCSWGRRIPYLVGGNATLLVMIGARLSRPAPAHSPPTHAARATRCPAGKAALFRLLLPLLIERAPERQRAEAGAGERESERKGARDLMFMDGEEESERLDADACLQGGQVHPTHRWHRWRRWSCDDAGDKQHPVERCGAMCGQKQQQSLGETSTWRNLGSTRPRRKEGARSKERFGCGACVRTAPLEARRPCGRTAPLEDALVEARA